MFLFLAVLGAVRTRVNQAVCHHLEIVQVQWTTGNLGLALVIPAPRVQPDETSKVYAVFHVLVRKRFGRLMSGDVFLRKLLKYRAGQPNPG